MSGHQVSPLDEFALIDNFFRGLGRHTAELSVGDDCALMQLAPGETLAVTTDTLVAGVHFIADCDAGLLARRCLRVNLSDLAAMGAEPRWFQLALTLPAVDRDWLQAFHDGLRADCEQYAIELTGGDTTRGPLTITLTLLGAVPVGKAMLRSGARPGDAVYVSGSLGDGRAALELLDDASQLKTAAESYLLNRYWLPEPRLALGQRLRPVASAAIDISDGLLADLGHICERSGVGAEIDLHRLPLSAALESMAPDRAVNWALSGGDDYELCFTVPPERIAQVDDIAAETGLQLAPVGRIVAGQRVRCLDAQGGETIVRERGYTHF